MTKKYRVYAATEQDEMTIFHETEVSANDIREALDMAEAVFGEKNVYQIEELTEEEA